MPGLSYDLVGPLEDPEQELRWRAEAAAERARQRRIAQWGKHGQPCHCADCARCRTELAVSADSTPAVVERAQ